MILRLEAAATRIACQQTLAARAFPDQTGCVGGTAPPPCWMESNPTTWQERFALTTCLAPGVASSIPPTALGVAVIYAPATADAGETVFLVIESRARALLAECERRLSTAKLPPLASLAVAFKADALADATPEAIHVACREQVIFAGELRRALRPAMR